MGGEELHARRDQRRDAVEPDRRGRDARDVIAAQSSIACSITAA